MDLTISCFHQEAYVHQDTGRAPWTPHAPLNVDGTQTIATLNKKMFIYLDHTEMVAAGKGVHYEFVKTVN